MMGERPDIRIRSVHASTTFEPLELEFTPTLDEMTDGYADLLRSDLEFRRLCAEYRRSRSLKAFLLSLILGLGLLSLPGLLGRQLYSHPVLTLAIFGLGPYAVYLVTSPSVRRFMEHRSWSISRRHCVDRARTLCAPMTVRLETDGVRVRGPTGEALIGWAGLNRVASGESGILIATQRAAGFIVPRSAFPDEGAMEAFVARIEESQRRNGAHLDDLARDVLNGLDTRCPMCGYNLKGAGRVICSECGFPLDRMHLEQLRDERVEPAASACSTR